MSLLTNLVAYYKFDESSGNAVDATGNGYTATNNGNVTYGTGKINNGAVFNGSNAKFTNNVHVNGDLTIAVWVKDNNNNWATYPWIFNDYTPGTGCNVQFMIYGSPVGEVRYARGNGSGTDPGLSDFGVTISSGAWHFLVVTQSGTSANLYVDGGSAIPLTMTYSGGASGITPAIGGRSSDNADPFNGTMDEMGFWSRALSSAEVTTLYNSGAGLQYPFAGNVLFPTDSQPISQPTNHYRPEIINA